MLKIVFSGFVICHLLAGFAAAGEPEQNPPVRIGWIGAMSGPAAKYGVYQAAQIALAEVNAAGGINGRKIELIAEDGRCDSKAAADAAMKLINVDKVKYILGGHCSPETMPIAPLAERSKVILLAALTSNPMLSSAGDYIFRLTAVSTRNADLLADHAYRTAGFRRLGIIAEETDYVRPIAERLKLQFENAGGKVIAKVNYNPGETDFRAMLTKMKAENPEAVYLGVQTPGTADLVVKQMRELGLNLQLYGNESTGSAPATTMLDKSYYEGLIFAQVAVDRTAPKTRAFIEGYRAKYGVSDIPYVLTPEAYDTLKVLAETIARCGDDVEKVKNCLYELKDYEGASGRISIDKNGDGVREHVLMTIRDGQPVSLKP